jgi:hypothetical protein
VSTGCTPFQLVYGQEAILPTEMELSSLRLMLQVEELNSFDVSQIMNALLALEEKRTFSLDNIKRRQQLLKYISTKVSRLSNLKLMRRYCCGIQLMLIEEGIQSSKNYGWVLLRLLLSWAQILTS